jgi:hypothetical protein
VADRRWPADLESTLYSRSARRSPTRSSTPRRTGSRFGWGPPGTRWSARSRGDGRGRPGAERRRAGRSGRPDPGDARLIAGGEPTARGTRLRVEVPCE